MSINTRSEINTTKKKHENHHYKKNKPGNNKNDKTVLHTYGFTNVKILFVLYIYYNFPGKEN